MKNPLLFWLSFYLSRLTSLYPERFVSLLFLLPVSDREGILTLGLAFLTKSRISSFAFGSLPANSFILFFSWAASLLARNDSIDLAEWTDGDLSQGLSRMILWTSSSFLSFKTIAEKFLTYESGFSFENEFDFSFLGVSKAFPDFLDGLSIDLLILANLDFL